MNQANDQSDDLQNKIIKLKIENLRQKIRTTLDLYRSNRFNKDQAVEQIMITIEKLIMGVLDC